MEIEGLLNSKLLQLMSIDMEKEQIRSLLHMGEEPEPEPPKVEPPKRQITMASPGQKPAQPAPPSASVYRAPEPQYDVRAGRSQPAPKMIAEEKQQVRSVKSASFDSFDVPESFLGQADIPMSNFRPY
jgi:hypothetical protein